MWNTMLFPLNMFTNHFLEDDDISVPVIYVVVKQKLLVVWS